MSFIHVAYNQEQVALAPLNPSWEIGVGIHERWAPERDER